MTITIFPARNEYTATAGQTIFNYTFKIYTDSDLQVFVTPSGQTADDSTDEVTGFAVSGVGNEAGGTVTLLSGASLGDLVTIVSSIPTNRTVDYQNNGDFLPDTVNGDFDRSVSLIKQANDLFNRTLVGQKSQQNTSGLSLPEPIAGYFLQWKPDLTGLQNMLLGSGDIVLPILKLSTYGDLASAVAAIGSTVVELWVDQSDSTINSPLAVPTNINLRHVSGFILNGTSTLTINGGLVAGLYQVFGENLTVDFGHGSVKEIREQWFDTTKRNTAYGIGALQADNVVGAANTSVGEDSMGAATGGAGNVAVGYRAHYNNTSGYNNVAIGDKPLFNNTTGSLNVAIGFAALEENTTGLDNIAIGADALKWCETGRRQIGIGINAVTNSVTGTHNQGIGYNSLRGNTEGNWNVGIGSATIQGAIGARAEGNITITGIPAVNGTFEINSTTFTWKATRTGAGEVEIGATIADCVFNLIEAVNPDTSDISVVVGGAAIATVFANDVGVVGNAYTFALGTATNMTFNPGTGTLAGGVDQPVNDGDGNIALGFQSMFSKSTGNNNFSVGTNAMYTNVDSSNLMGIGTRSLFIAGTGTNDTVAIGSNSLENVEDDSSNTVSVGSQSGRYYTGLLDMTDAKNSVFIGFRTRGAAAVTENTIAIGSNAESLGDNTIVIGTSTIDTSIVYGTQLSEQLNPATKTTTSTLTISDLLSRIITGTHTAGGNQNYTLPNATNIDAGTTMVSDSRFDWSLINLSAGVNTITIVANTGHTIVGNPVIDAETSASFATRELGTGDYVTYRLN